LGYIPSPQPYVIPTIHARVGERLYLHDHIATGRSAEVRAPSAAELDTTAILSVALEEVSAKIREGGPVDKSDDLALPVWAGQLPVTTAALTPIHGCELY
jgi:uncharacterized protein